jgi:LacI family transcriptional regulator
MRRLASRERQRTRSEAFRYAFRKDSANTRTGFGMANIYDVAKLAGVSIATVSAVLNKSANVSPELTRRVKVAVDELDFTINHLAHALQTRSTRTIGMLIPSVGAPDPFIGQVVRGAEDILRKKEYLLILGHTYNRVVEQSRYLKAFRARLVDGVLLFKSPGEDEELKRLLKAKKPVIFVGRIPSDAEGDIIATDILYGTRKVMEYLCDKGHRRIGLITVAASLSVTSFRLAAWRDALEHRGIAIDESLAVSGEVSMDAGGKAAAQILSLPDPPTAIFADNLVVATGVLRVLQERGLRCPQDVEVVSSDDAEWLDVFRPPITTIVQPSYELGAQAAQLLLKRIRHPRRPLQKVLLRPELKVRI